MTRGWQLHLGARSETGSRRNHNEDSVAVFTDRGLRSDDHAQADRLSTASGVLLAILDGMGGQSTGGRACQLIVASLADQVARPWPADADARAAWLADTITKASAHLAANARGTGQGATVVLAAVLGDTVHVAHAGDARLYLLQGGQLTQRTRDDSLANLEHGLPGIDLAQVPRGIVTQALGYGDIEPHVQSFTLAAGDTLLLTTDGLHEHVPAEDLAAILAAHPEPADACAALVARAEQAGSDDNFSAVVARLEPA